MVIKMVVEQICTEEDLVE